MSRLVNDPILLAAHAKALIDNPLLNAALENYELEITESWKKSSLKDQPTQLELRRMLAAAQHLRSYLEKTIQTGNLEKAFHERKGPLQHLKAWTGRT